MLLTVGFFDHSSLWQIFTWLHAATSSSLLDTAASVTAQWAKKWENGAMNNLMRLHDYFKKAKVKGLLKLFTPIQNNFKKH